ncbi:GNAT family N-acetyltransferase [Paenibacillus radicis (ex Xue et al. 2023)]|uniref:GNAT family N-acetyltransferase n=1 Tax=Paenibacillus radicis (ex Xue et al. 2023) TaxID=2972489 RepID=A0ABT1YRE9_9BACL|nr:GNAT family N-acetyltransferase [Paenibacillus radicis (ex Xue et al. 2023)]MCR8634560.1 GNAT family N-acetyltransferase [Paenibacillus radicis (ex Xue et al. 2023)]
MMVIKELDDHLRKGINDFRGMIIVSRNQVHSLEKLPGYVVLFDGEIKGLITYNMNEHDCEIVSLDSKVEGQGIGTTLIDLVIAKAREDGCKRVWLITSNDNIRAIRFYQKRGFNIKAVYENAITEARKIKPSIPLIGFDGIPVRHEIEFDYIL